MVPWCSGQTCGPVKAEIAGSNPVGTAIFDAVLSEAQARNRSPLPKPSKPEECRTGHSLHFGPTLESVGITTSTMVGLYLGDKSGSIHYDCIYTLPFKAERLAELALRYKFNCI